ncbi:tryptophan synthase subunit alpha [Hylemonella gracilis]|uniref:Tryptophan synthase alpha chain n=1 Tax=Hylemonella gracilis ATCC 19624 TaxID=887062 RepID=F3KRZ0_9BURK|nr:tryptophan synthase subunit alpha [Hylemonella gracilis]EGI77474.1 tryptophan synthase subunit alpha [Hylemonella gracilis ATCC 19624]
MSRITTTFEKLKSEQRKALIPFVTAGYPYPDITPALMAGLVEAGADVIELGVPFSDPSADGPVIQAAGDKALAAGIGLKQVLAMVREFRLKNQTTPVVLMGYANPIERYDQLHGSHGAASPTSNTAESAFVRDAAAAGVDGVLVVDYPPEECADFAARLKANDMDLIFLLAPTSTDERMAQVARLASGYVYYVSLKGVTGSGALDTSAVQAMLPRIRQHVKIPVGVGFGIRDAETAKAIGASADAVVIGSRILQLIGDKPHAQVVTVAMDFLRGIRRALDSLEG